LFVFEIPTKYIAATQGILWRGVNKKCVVSTAWFFKHTFYFQIFADIRYSQKLREICSRRPKTAGARSHRIFCILFSESLDTVGAHSRNKSDEAKARSAGTSRWKTLGRHIDNFFALVMIMLAVAPVVIVLVFVVVVITIITIVIGIGFSA